MGEIIQPTKPHSTTVKPSINNGLRPQNRPMTNMNRVNENLPKPRIIHDVEEIKKPEFARTDEVIKTTTDDLIPEHISLKIRTLCIGFGQGGSKMAFETGKAIGNPAENVLIFNTSYNDIKGIVEAGLPKARSLHIGEAAREGSGKTRKKAQIAMSKSIEEITGHIQDELKRTMYDLVLVFFSTAGGTGSGIGPKLTYGLNSESFYERIKDVYKYRLPCITGVAICPDLSSNEGTVSLENTIECLNDIHNCINESRYFIVYNGSSPDRLKTRTEQHELINKSVAKTFARYLSTFGVSRSATLDRSDRINSMEYMGIHSFMKIDTNGRKADTAFFTPEGERVRRCTYEVGENDNLEMENKVISYVTSQNILADDIIHGLYDSTNQKNSVDLWPIISFHGSVNVSKISERFSLRLQKIKEDVAQLEQTNTADARGFDNLHNEKEYREKEYGTRTTNKTFAELFPEE